MHRILKSQLTNAFFFALIFVCEILSSEIPRPRGVSLSRAALYDPEKDFTCFDGSLTIPFTQVNDDYCDCPDASDEPGTSACPHGTFYCINAGFRPKNIPSNRVNDGVCDCCDASDEFASNAKCVNNCDELGRSAREEAQKQAELVRIGAQMRQELSQKGTLLKQEKKDKLAELEKNRQEAEQVLLEKEALKKEAEEDESIALEVYRELEKKKEAAEASQAQENASETTQDSKPTDEQLDMQEGEDVERGEEEKPQEHEGENEEEVQQGEEAEDEPDDDDEEEEEEVAPQPPKEEPQVTYDEETQRLVDRANEARREFESARSAVRDLTKEIESLQEYLEKDFGPDEEFAPLEGNCFEYTDREYIYKLCPFDKTIQQPKSSSSETRLGRWSKWDGPSHNKYEVMVYDHGQACWNGPTRSTRVKVSCGSENQIVSVTEPNRCEYFFDFVTPAACRLIHTESIDLHDEL